MSDGAESWNPVIDVGPTAVVPMSAVLPPLPLLVVPKPSVVMPAEPPKVPNRCTAPGAGAGPAGPGTPAPAPAAGPSTPGPPRIFASSPPPHAPINALNNSAANHTALLEQTSDLFIFTLPSGPGAVCAVRTNVPNAASWTKDRLPAPALPCVAVHTLLFVRLRTKPEHDCQLAHIKKKDPRGSFSILLFVA